MATNELTPEQLEHRRAYKRKWYLDHAAITIARATKRQAEHPEGHAVANHKWYVPNAKRVAARLQKWRVANRDKVHAQVNGSYIRNGVKIRARRHARYLEDPAKSAAYDRKWREAHPDEIRARNANRRVRRIPLPGEHTAADIVALYEAQQRLCAACHTPITRKGSTRYEVDHIIPVKARKGHPRGSNGPENLQLLCVRCNRAKSNMSAAQWEARRATMKAPR
jgi:5-methylcytosine-specific restriction endonuclease McrA